LPPDAFVGRLDAYKKTLSIRRQLIYVNSKQIMAALSVVVLVTILGYPALSTGTVSILLRSTKIEQADHVYTSVSNVWVHRLGQSSSDGWELASNQSLTVDLVSLENTTMTVAKAQIPVGSYDGIRIEISNVTWVFNKTTTRLSVELSRLQTKLEFTTQAGRGSTITLVLSGHTEEVRGIKSFVSYVNATLGGVPSS
jgi:hypothetical protein